ncbi:MAG TPA: rRNA maturation RNase YbeY [Ardenticatenaceae bacterium]
MAMDEPSRIHIQIEPQYEPRVDAARLERAARAVFEAEGLAGDPALSLVIVGDEEMTRLHEAYRDEPGTTDVLAFNYEDEAEDEEMAGYLGDVIVCYPQAERQRTEGTEVQDELDLLAAHGTLHLLGYDDETPEEKARMWQQQQLVMERLGLGHVAPR